MSIETTSLTLEGGAIISADTISSGDANELNIKTNRLKIIGGSRIGVATGNKGNGGTLTINDADSVELIGVSSLDSKVSSGLFANTEEGSEGKGGTIKINTNGYLTTREK